MRAFNYYKRGGECLNNMDNASHVYLPCVRNGMDKVSSKYRIRGSRENVLFKWDSIHAAAVMPLPYYHLYLIEFFESIFDDCFDGTAYCNYHLRFFNNKNDNKRS